MATKPPFWTIGLALLLLLLGGPVRADDRSNALVIIVSKKTGIDNLSSADLGKYFRCEKARDADGNKVVIVMREHGSIERAAVLRQIYRMTEAEYQTYFLQATFTGQVPSAPKKLVNAAAVRQFVADDPGAIGYVRQSDLDDSVKVLKIDGKAPCDSDYSLKLR